MKWRHANICPLCENPEWTRKSPLRQSGVQAALADMRAFLVLTGLSGNDCGTAEIVLAKALNNVAEHAYGMINAGFVTVTIALCRNGATIDILDAGAPLPALTPPNDSLPDGGFGWFLIRSLTSGLTYRRRAEHNHLRLYLDLSL